MANGSCVPTSASNMTGNYTDKGNALGSLGNYAGAIIYYDKALAINPNYQVALNGKGNALDKLGTATPGNAAKFLKYENSTYGIRVQYPSDWTIQESNASGTLINIARFVSPTGPNSNPTAEVTIYSRVN
ncbi:MAG: tetratricopeptide repeat protein [Candidatus Nitrosopolaris sp.]